MRSDSLFLWMFFFFFFFFSGRGKEVSLFKGINLPHYQHEYSPHCTSYICNVTSQENLFEILRGKFHTNLLSFQNPKMFVR